MTRKPCSDKQFAFALLAKSWTLAHSVRAKGIEVVGWRVNAPPGSMRD
jgi:hypothetical protein